MTQDSIPYGHCHCGCGGKAPIAKNSVPAYGYVKGEPKRFIRGHASRKNQDFFDRRFDRLGDDECWIWKGRIDPYGRPRYGGGNRLAHRVAYQRHFGALGEFDQLMHICGDFLCVNPRHLALKQTSPPAPNPSGLCWCGCGTPTPLAAQSNTLFGHRRGHPMRFVRGHAGNQKTRPALDSTRWNEEDRGWGTPCWIWNLKTEYNGYARITIRGRCFSAHRTAYTEAKGPIPPGLQIDHLCGQKACINPDHLEAVTPSVNTRRGLARAGLLRNI